MTFDISFWIQKPSKNISFWTQFLVDHPETNIMDQFMDPETDIMGELYATYEFIHKYLFPIGQLTFTFYEQWKD